MIEINICEKRLEENFARKPATCFLEIKKDNCAFIHFNLKKKHILFLREKNEIFKFSFTAVLKKLVFFIIKSSIRKIYLKVFLNDSIEVLKKRESEIISDKALPQQRSPLSTWSHHLVEKSVNACQFYARGYICWPRRPGALIYGQELPKVKNCHALTCTCQGLQNVQGSFRFKCLNFSKKDTFDSRYIAWKTSRKT